jgi:hypothetical protein
MDQASNSDGTMMDNLNACNNVGEFSVKMMLDLVRGPRHLASSPAVLGREPENFHVSSVSDESN